MINVTADIAKKLTPIDYSIMTAAKRGHRCYQHGLRGQESLNSSYLINNLKSKGFMVHEFSGPDYHYININW